MAVTTDNLLVNVAVNTENAAKSLEQLTKQLSDLKLSFDKAGKSSEKTSDSLTGVGAAFVKLAGGISVAKAAYEGFQKVIDATVKGFLEQDSAQRRLGNILKATGELTKDVYGDFEDFANGMMETANIGDELTYQLLSMSKAAGLTNDQSKQLIKTAADLSVVTGKDLKGSFDALMGQYAGITGREIPKLIPALKDLTEEELKAGKGIEIVAKQFAGFAANEAQTTQGQLEAMKISFGELMETVGQIIIEILNLGDSSKSVSENLKSINKSLLENKEMWVSVGKVIVSFVDDTLDILISGLSFIGATIVGVGQKVTMLVTAFTKAGSVIGVIPESWARSMSELDESLKQTANNLSDVGVEAFKNLGDSGDRAMEQITDAAYKVDAGLKGVVKTARAVGPSLKDLLKEGEKALDDLTKKITDLQTKSAEIGANEGEVVRQRYEQHNKEIKAMEEKISLAGLLNAKNKELLAQATALANMTMEKEIGELRRKNLEEILLRNKELALEVKENDLTTRQLIDAQTEMLIEQLEIKAKGLELDEEGRKAIADQIDLLKQRATLENSKAPSDTYDKMKKGGESIAQSISSVFTSGALEMVGGMASAVSAIVSAANAVLDMIPNMLNSVADLADKITDFPNVLFKAVDRLTDSLIKMITDAIPNIFKRVPEILDDLITAVFEEFPAAIEQLLAGLPDMIEGFLERIPELVERLVSGLMTNAPRIAMALMDFLIKEGPKLAMVMMEYWMIELPKAILKGLVEGIKQLGKMIQNFFSGKGTGFKIDTKSLEKQLKGIFRSLSGETSKLFAVMDLGEGAKAAEQAKNLADNIEEGMRRAGNWLQEVWNKLLTLLKDAWMWIWTTILKPIIDGLTAVWRWVWDTILSPLLNGLKEVWNTILELLKSVWSGLMGLLTSTWDLIVTTMTKVWEGLTSIVQTAFTWVKTNIVDPLKGIGKTAFEWVKTNIIDKLTNFKMPTFSWPSLPKWTWPEIPTPQWLKDLGNIGGGGGGGGNILTNTVSSIGSAIGLSHGGPVYAQAGMFIPRGTDTVPSMLTPGEYVVNANAVRSLGMGAMESINQGKLPSGQGDTNVSVNMQITTTEPVNESFVRTKLVPKIKEELRRASLDGAFILSSSGIR